MRFHGVGGVVAGTKVVEGLKTGREKGRRGHKKRSVYAGLLMAVVAGAGFGGVNAFGASATWLNCPAPDPVTEIVAEPPAIPSTPKASLTLDVAPFPVMLNSPPLLKVTLAELPMRFALARASTLLLPPQGRLLIHRGSVSPARATRRLRAL